MKILFAASELNPIIKVGGLADVVGSLSKEIKRAGHDIRIVIPFYKPLKRKKLDSLIKIGRTQININGRNEEVGIFQTVVTGMGSSNKAVKVPVYLLENETYISGGDVYLDSNDFSSMARFLFFSKAVLKIFKVVNWRPDIIHAHDWQTAFIIPLVKLEFKNAKVRIKTLFTIHNLLIQGRWNYNQTLKFLGLKGNEILSLKYKFPSIYGDDFNTVQQAILCADIITTVSPNYAQEIKTKTYYARGLQKVIQKRKQDIYGILNGIGIYIFNPETDNYINKHYSVKRLRYKAVNKLYLQKEVGFIQDLQTPLLAVISRLDIQKGIDLLVSAADEIIQLGCQIVFLGIGYKKYETMLIQLSKKYPRRIATYIRFDPELAQQIYAGADIFLMPSRFEPCGLSQLIAMRYGTIPLVRATGGLKDSVENINLTSRLFGLTKKVNGTGFTFKRFTKDRLIATLKRALKIYSQKSLWKQLQINAMKKDFSWRRSAKKYLELYKKLIS